MATPEPTDRQIAAAIYRITRVYLEVERGLRPPEHLARLLTKPEYERHRRHPLRLQSRAGPVVPDDIGRLQIDRSVLGQVTASVPTRENGDRWGALVIHLRQQHTGWTVDQLQRVPRPQLDRHRGTGDARQAVAPEAPRTEGPAWREELVANERELVSAAKRAVESSLRELEVIGGSTDARAELLQQIDRWTSRLDDLDREQRALRPPADDVVALRLANVLGEPPHEPHRRRAWEDAYEQVHSYRQLWEVNDPHTLLGPEADYAGQRRHRNRVIQTLRDSLTELRRPGHGREHDNPHSVAEHPIGIER